MAPPETLRERSAALTVTLPEPWEPPDGKEMLLLAAWRGKRSWKTSPARGL